MQPCFLSVLLNAPYHPLFESIDPEAETFGNYTNENRHAIVRKKLDSCTSWYVALPAYEPELIKGIINMTHAHIYDQDGDIIYSGNGFLTCHFKKGGNKSVDLINGKKIKFQAGDNSTIIMNNSTGEILLK